MAVYMLLFKELSDLLDHQGCMDHWRYYLRSFQSKRIAPKCHLHSKRVQWDSIGATTQKIVVAALWVNPVLVAFLEGQGFAYGKHFALLALSSLLHGKYLPEHVIVLLSKWSMSSVGENNFLWDALDGGKHTHSDYWRHIKRSLVVIIYSGSQMLLRYAFASFWIWYHCNVNIRECQGQG